MVIFAIVIICVFCVSVCAISQAVNYEDVKDLAKILKLLQLEDRLGSVSRGAVQTTIERFTFPHKYKKVRQKTVISGC